MNSSSQVSRYFIYFIKETDQPDDNGSNNGEVISNNSSVIIS